MHLAAGARPAPGQVVLTAALAAVLAALAGLGLASTFDRPDLYRPVAAGALGGAAVSAVVTGIARQRLATAVLTGVALFGPVGMLATGGGPPDVLAGFWRGVSMIRSSAVPTPVDPRVLVVPFGSTAVAAFLGTDIGLRARSAVAATLPSLVAFVIALGFGLDGSRPDGWVITAWVVVAGLVVGLRRPGRVVGAGSLRPMLLVAPVALAAAVAGHAVAPRLPAGNRDRFEWHRPDQPAPQPPADSPLVLIAALLEGPDDPLFVAETSEPVDRWRLAVLDTYDGNTWENDVSYVPVGRRLPDPPGGGPAGAVEVTQEITPRAIEGQWLPVAGQPEEISLDGALFDAESGTLLTPGSRLPASYAARSVIAQPDPGALLAARVATDDEATRALELPPGSRDIAGKAEEITQGATSPYQRATAIERFLAQSTAPVPFELAVEQPETGYSLGHLRCFLFDVERCQHQGSTERFVAAYAVLARSVGLPTRIVVGFNGSGSAGHDEVTAHDAIAWAEVKFEGLGWVPFDPVPNPDVTVTPPPEDVPGSRDLGDDQTSTTVALPEDDVAGGRDAGREEATDEGHLVLPWLVAGGITLVALTVPTTARVRRRRRRRKPRDPAVRVAGAWAEAVDHLARSGVPASPAAAVRDVVRAGQRELDRVAEPLGPLGEVVNRTRFAPAGAADADADAVEAWRLSDAFVDRRRRSRTVPQRAREAFSLRSPANRVAREARLRRRVTRS